MVALNSNVPGKFVLIPGLFLDEREYWRSITYVFFSASVWQLAAAVLALVGLGRIVERRIGSSRYCLVCFLPVFAAGLAFIVLHRGDGTVSALAGPHFMTSGVTAAAITLNLRSVDIRTWWHWAIGIAVACYVIVVGVAPLDILVMNLLAWVTAGVLVIKEVLNARAA
jgi:membrane associated rhomboid family serine protease